MEEYIYALDIGGTSIKACIATISGDLKHFFSFTFAGGESLLVEAKENLFSKIAELKINYNQIKIIAIATKGAFDDQTGIVINAKGIGWINYPLVKNAKTIFNRPIAVNNDCRSATIGEWKYGVARGYQNFICVALGRGVGSGIVLNNKLLTGEFNGAGEIGHGGYTQNLRGCDCGLKYCCEGISSATGIEWYINYYASFHENTSIGMLRRELERPLVFPDVDPLIDARDVTTEKVIKRAVRPLASRISQVIFLLDIKAVFFGGKISEVLGSNLINPIKAQVQEMLWPAQKKRVVFKNFELGNRAALYGIVAWAIQKQEAKELY